MNEVHNGGPANQYGGSYLEGQMESLEVYPHSIVGMQIFIEKYIGLQR